MKNRRKATIFFFELVVCFIFFNAICFASDQHTQLFKDLACSSCHYGLSINSDILEKAPDLSYAGLRYNPAYLFEYLQHPVKVRQNIGASRMPNFFFDKRESLALSLFLTTQLNVVGKWPEYPSGIDKDSKSDNPTQAKTIITDMCLKCHTFEGKGESLAVELADIGFRLNREWVKKWLIAPSVFQPETTMPELFYQLNKKQNSFVELMPEAARQINITTQYLFTQSKIARNRLEISYKKAKTEFPEITKEMGEMIFISQNCAACHKTLNKTQKSKKNAPDLTLEGVRVKKEWLQAYLKKPTPVRPFGFYPGSGSRMPYFGLSEKEIKIISDYLMKQSRGFLSKTTPFKPKKLSLFSMNKAKTLLQKKLACLGCHQLGDEGGKIGPNLSSLKKRLNPLFVYNFIRNPKSIMPETTMPKIVMPEATSKLITNFLFQQEIPINNPSYLSLIDTPVHFYEKESGGAQSLYLKYCAACHGITGDGKGYNAKNLPVPPTHHSDKAYMSQRPDDTLFDGTYAGGYILNKSHTMPPWGYTLSYSEIRQLVGYTRELCQCKGPIWSEDNKNTRDH